MIRAFRPKDRALYLELTREFYRSGAADHPVPDEYLERTFDELMRSALRAEAFLFEEDGAAVGFALLAKTWSQEAGGEAIWIEELYVRPAFRGRGIGQAFFRELRERFHPARFRLETEPDNLRAKALYRRQGFTELPYESMVSDQK